MSANTSNLKSSMMINAVFSVLTGAPLAFFPRPSSDILGVQPSWLLSVAGFILLFHAIVLVAVSSRPSVRSWAKVNLVMIAPYPFLIIAFIAAGLISGPMGIALAACDGLIVGCIAIWQFKALGAVRDLAS